MARGINKVILIGNVGQDPEVKYMPSGGAVTNISVATTDSWKDKNTGQPQERTEWHRVVFFGRLAEIAGEYLRKGSKVYIEGSLRTRKWQGQDGSDRYTTEIVVDVGGTMQMLDGRGDNAGGGAGMGAAAAMGAFDQTPQYNNGPQAGPQGGGYNQAAAGGYAQQSPASRNFNQAPQQPQHQQPAQHNAPPAAGFDSFDDDIPF